MHRSRTHADTRRPYPDPDSRSTHSDARRANADSRIVYVGPGRRGPDAEARCACYDSIAGFPHTDTGCAHISARRADARIGEKQYLLARARIRTLGPDAKRYDGEHDGEDEREEHERLGDMSHRKSVSSTQSRVAALSAACSVARAPVRMFIIA